MSEWKEEVLPGIPVENVAFSTDNKIVAVSSQYQVILRDVNQIGSAPRVITCNSPVVSVRFFSSVELIVVTDDGELTTWNVSSEDMEKKDSRRVTAFPVKNVIWGKTKTESVWILAGGSRQGFDTLNVLMNDQTLEKLEEIPSYLAKDQVALGDSFVVYCYQKNIVKISLDPEDEEDSHKETFVYTSVLNGLSAEENEKNVFVRIAANGDTVVASLSIGKVYVWSNVATKPFTLSSAYTLHWHKVSAPMAITSFGGLISAGAETVLCKWTLKGAGAPTLMSRLQAAVTKVTLSPDGSLACLIMEDNSVHVVLLSSMSILCSLPSIVHSTRCAQSVFLPDERAPGSVVMNGTPGWIQWLGIGDESTQKQACLSLENAVEGDMSEVRFTRTYHQLENLSLSENFAASLESLVNFSQDHKRLRFWRRASTFDLEIMHSVSVPTNTDFIAGCSKPISESDNIFITCQSTGSIDVWSQYGEQAHWVKDTARSLSAWQDTPIVCVSSVAPGAHWASVHKVGANHDVVIWDASKMRVVDVFRADSEVRYLEWASDSLLVVSTAQSITGWSLHTASAKWSVEQALNCHISANGCFCWENEQVIQFDSNTGKLLKTFRFSSPVDSLVAVKAPTLQHVVLIAKTQKGLAVMKNGELRVESEDVVMGETPFSRLSAIPHAAGVSTTPSVRIATTKNVMKLLDAPCHALPPLSHIAPLFISSCLAPPCEV